MNKKQKKSSKPILSDKIADALTVKPSVDIEDDHVFGTKPQTLTKNDFGSSESEDEAAISDFRKRNINLLSEISNKYEGQVVSRKEIEGSESGGYEDSDSESGALNLTQIGIDVNSDVSEDSEHKSDSKSKEKQKLKKSLSWSNQDSSKKQTGSKTTTSSPDSDRVSSSEDESDDYSIIQNVKKQIQGSSDEDDDESVKDEVSGEDEESADDEGGGGYDISQMDEPMKEEFEHVKKQNVSEEVKKGACVRNQLLIWEGLLEKRIHLQRCMNTANQMPLPETHKELQKDEVFTEQCSVTRTNIATVLDNGSGDLRDKGRSWGRCRGRTRDCSQSSNYGNESTPSSTPPDNKLQKVDLPRRVSKSSRNASRPAVSKELIQKKRTAGVLFPEKTPKKARAVNPSPERGLCVFLQEENKMDVKSEPPSAEPAYIGSYENEADFRSVGLTGTKSPEIVFDMEIELIQESESGCSQQKPRRDVIGVNEVIFDSTFEDNYRTEYNEDDPLNIDEMDGIPLLAMNQRTADDQSADNTGLSLAEIAIIQQEEASSDRHIRELAPSKDYYDFDWSEDRQTFSGKREVFTGNPGPTFPVTKSITELDIFYKMFDNDFIDMMVTETNRYADKALAAARRDSTKKKSRILRWTPTDRNEMVAFLAVIILQGLYPKIKEEAYFGNDGFGTMPYFGRIMSYNRYFLLKTFHHFVNNDSLRDRTKLNKIRPVIDYLNDKFARLYYPAQEIAIDESLLKWHGRLSFSQKIKTKAAKVGVKTYELCESSTGYLWRFFVYTDKDGPNRPDNDGEIPGTDIDDVDRTKSGNEDGGRSEPDNNIVSSSDVRPSGATAKIVYDLVRPLLHKGHTLIMDNFYNSPLLARCLKRDGRTDVFGTLRVSREFVPEPMKYLTKKDLNQGQVVDMYCSDLAVMLWRDFNLVGLISTYHHLQIGTAETRNGTRKKPTVVLDYNKYMRGVDRKDQYLAGQPIERDRNLIWYKKLFRRLFNAALFNCFVIFTSNKFHKVSHRQFRTALAEGLLKVHKQIDLSREPRIFNIRVKQTTIPKITTLAQLKGQTRPYVEGNHFPEKSGSGFTRCWMCSRNKKPSRTSYRCIECQVNLCIIGCFREYHKPPAPVRRNDDSD